MNQLADAIQNMNQLADTIQKMSQLAVVKQSTGLNCKFKRKYEN